MRSVRVCLAAAPYAYKDFGKHTCQIRRVLVQCREADGFEDRGREGAEGIC